MTTVIETCGVAPPPCAATAEVTVPLCLFDIMWIHTNPTSYLVFYDHPCSEAEFLAAIVGNLKHSLSLALKTYLPVAGNLLYPIDIEKSKPVIRYVSGDSVPFTVAVSSRDFDELAGSHPRDSDQFYEFLPAKPPLREESDHMLVPLVAIQATLFPGRGICIGLANHHCLCDARSTAAYIWAWAEINKRGGGGEVLSGDGEPPLPPLFDRSVFGDCSEVNEMYWKAVGKTPLKPSSFPLPTNRVRASFTLHRSDIEKLKNLVRSKNPNLAHVSSFVVTAAYTWSCVARSGCGGGEEAFLCPADARGRRNALVDPPPPANYFGNCIGGGAARLEHEKVAAAADGGFLTAAAAIAGMIESQINDGDNFLRGSKYWLSGMAQAAEMSHLGVTGSPKYDLAEADFGWGKGRRVEVLSLDENNYMMSVCNSWDSGGGGGLVVGLSLPRERMEAVAAIFQDGLLNL